MGTLLGWEGSPPSPAAYAAGTLEHTAQMSRPNPCAAQEQLDLVSKVCGLVDHRAQVARLDSRVGRLEARAVSGATGGLVQWQA